MPIDIYIIIICVYRAHNGKVVGHLYPRTFIYRTFNIGGNPIIDSSIAYCQDVLRLASFGIDHCPHASPIAIHLATIPYDTEIAVGEISHGTLHPCFHIKRGILLRHLVNLDGKTREHPCLVDGIQVVHTESTLRGMEIGGIEHVIAQMPHEQTVGEVAMKRLGSKTI